MQRALDHDVAVAGVVEDDDTRRGPVAAGSHGDDQVECQEDIEGDEYLEEVAGIDSGHEDP